MPSRQPGLGPVVLDEDRRARAEHPIAARGGVLEVRGSRPLDPGLHGGPAFGHVALEHQIGTDRGQGVQLRRRIAEAFGQRDRGPAMLDRLLQAPVEHVRGRQAGFEPKPGGLHLRTGGDGVELADRVLERPDPGLEVVAEQVPDRHERGDDRRRPDRSVGHEVALTGLCVGLGGGLVLVEGGGLGRERLEDLGMTRRVEVLRQVAQRPPVELGRLPMRRPAGGRPRPGDGRLERIGRPSRALEVPRPERPRRRPAGPRPARRPGRACRAASAPGRRRRSRRG